MSEQIKKKTYTVSTDRETYETLSLIAERSGMSIAQILREWSLSLKEVLENLSLPYDRLNVMSVRNDRDNVSVTYLGSIVFGSKLISLPCPPHVETITIHKTLSGEIAKKEEVK